MLFASAFPAYKSRQPKVLAIDVQCEVMLFPLLLQLVLLFFFFVEEGLERRRHRLQGVIHPCEVLQLHPIRSQHLQGRPGRSGRQSGGELEVHSVQPRAKALDHLAEGLVNLFFSKRILPKDLPKDSKRLLLSIVSAFALALWPNGTLPPGRSFARKRDDSA